MSDVAPVAAQRRLRHHLWRHLQHRPRRRHSRHLQHRPHWRHHGQDDGQATVELALATPVLCLLLLGIVQLVVIVRAQLAVIEAARVGARAAAAAADPAAAALAAVADVNGGHSPTTRVSSSTDGRYVTVTVAATSVTDIPLIGALLPDVEVSGRATMILEPP